MTMDFFRSKKKYLRQTYSAVMASLSYFAIGEIRSWSSSGIPSLQGKDGRNATLSQGPLPLEVTSWITSTPPLGAILFALIAGLVLQKYGRKVTLIAAVSVTFVAFLILATAQLHEIPGVMIGARVMMGITVGFSMPSATIYISECTDPKIRGLLGSLPPVFMALGISYIYLLGAFLPWHLLAYVCCAVPFVTVVGVMFAPESPVWLKANGRLGEAERAANWLKGEDSAKLKPVNSDSSFEVPSKVDLLDDRETLSFLSELKSKAVWHPFSLCLAIMIFQQWSGVNAVIFNTVTIFNAANVNMDQYLATNIVGVVQLVATFLSTLVVDKAGRRVLLLISGVVMAVPMASLGAFFYLTSGDPDSLDPAWRSSLEWVPLVCLIVYMIGYSVGFACVPFLLLGELLPSRMRNLLGAAVSSFNLLMTFLVLKFFATVHMAIGFHGLFWIYASVAVVGGAFGFVFIPETKGRSLKDIELHFSGINLLGTRDMS